ncbi:MAG: oxidoreductase [Chloroflexi bacterium]|nr:2-dehydropantoate 2-reductase [Dehalococcoidia bacterium]PKB82025.1 MAG: 2-dehydropantoate 2-reductase [SAR202 cluster bacterium MP-SInd-SRR3963457-G1]PKB85341.1 MAG: 2-dehydropantoate 2-reductase [SAR202 cluster bacterium MP-NPac-SRR3961935-G1]RUA29430.1 MAG: oxidoreductase [Chloroflexota bacterium]
MKIAIVGAGAIGAFLGAKLALSGEDVYLIARGPHLRAMQADGVRVRSPEGDFEAHPTATDDYESIGPVDFVFLTVKAHSLTGIAPNLAPLLGPDTAVVSAQNGIPWWYFMGHGGPFDGESIESVDPGGVIAGAIDQSRIIGCVIYPSTAIVEPGVIEHIEGNRFSLGELDGSSSDRCKRLAGAFIAAGLRAPIRGHIRHDMWIKLLGNVVFNPMSALTGATLVEMVTHPETSATVRAVMTEADEVAQGLGVRLPFTVEQRMEGARKVGAHKTSMLQDLEAGRPMELESVVGVVIELGEKLGLPMPLTRTLYSCARLLEQVRGN